LQFRERETPQHAFWTLLRIARFIWLAVNFATHPASHLHDERRDCIVTHDAIPYRAIALFAHDSSEHIATFHGDAYHWARGWTVAIGLITKSGLRQQ
jgi:hypothetical protein